MPSDNGMPVHRTVLLHEAVDSLSIQESDIVVDATLGGAGHAKEISSQLGKKGVLIAFDADADAIERGKDALRTSKATVHFVHANFRRIREELQTRGIERVDKALFDLGWSQYQLSSGRGFSFLSDEPLSMAYDKNQHLSAHTIVNEWQEESLADIVYGWGEERYSRRIARAIVAARDEKPITTARELADIVKDAVPPAARYKRTHPATKTFQALRIAVNDELGSLEEAIRNTWQMLNEGGRIAVISFHSLEDRIVKQRFRELAEKGEALLITKKPITASDEELEMNPRARSAKLRVIEKKHHG